MADDCSVEPNVFDVRSRECCCRLRFCSELQGFQLMYRLFLELRHRQLLEVEAHTFDIVTCSKILKFGS